MQENESNRLFSPVWNAKKDTLYVCVGPTFRKSETVQILAISRVSEDDRTIKYLTDEGHNSAFPSTNPDGIKFSFCTIR